MAKNPNKSAKPATGDTFDTSNGATAPAVDTKAADAEVMAKAKAELKAKEDATKAEKVAAREAAKAEKDAAKAEKAAAREAAKAERQARIAELAEGKTYHGSMLALADRVKSGAYVKGANGQLRTTDELAIALDGASPTDVIRIGLDVLQVEDNPYVKLNVGQQSMNLRNRMRGAIKKGTLTIAQVVEYMVRNKIHVTTAADLEAAAQAKAEKKAAREAEAEAKRVAKAAAPKAAAKIAPAQAAA